jgi:hypothetical protein
MTGNMASHENIAAATSSILSLVYHTFGLRTAFIARTGDDRFLAVEVQDYGGCNLAQGTNLPLEESY